mgnify:CR=1 FL=1
MRVLVVGGAGYVGSVLVREFLREGYQVRVLDNLLYGRRGLQELLGKEPELELIVQDMREVDRSVFDDVDAVVNLGGFSNDPIADRFPELNFELNTDAAVRLAELALECGVRRYVLASTCSVYDSGDDELGDVVKTEDYPVAPTAAYSRSKLEAEKALFALRDEGLCPIALRKGTIYGYSPRMRFDLVVNTMVMTALRDGRILLHRGGEMWRPLVSVLDVAKAYVLALTAPEDQVSGQVFNIVYCNYRISELGLRIAHQLRCMDIQVSVEPDYTPRKVRNYRVSGTRAHRVLGFTPEVSVEQAVAEMVEKLRAITDLDNPRYYNIRWVELLHELELSGHPEKVFVRGSSVG